MIVSRLPAGYAAALKGLCACDLLRCLPLASHRARQCLVVSSFAGIKKGSGKPHTDKVGKVTRAQLAEIAEIKKDQLNAIDEDGRIKVIAGTARSMGVEVIG